MEDWLSQQLSAPDVIERSNNWLEELLRKKPDQAKPWASPENFLHALENDWNMLDAVRTIDWQAILNGTAMRVLDLGCGVGWLTAFLSRFENVAAIDALDSDRTSLGHMLPGLVRLMGGELGKVRPVRGRFAPLLTDNASYDLIVACSALHHAENMGEILSELRRTLKPEGRLIILNETPLAQSEYVWLAAKLMLKIAVATLRKTVPDNSPWISAAGVLYDPRLGDRHYALWQWDRMLKAAGFDYRLCRTPYGYLKKGPPGYRLCHFVCRPA